MQHNHGLYELVPSSTSSDPSSLKTPQTSVVDGQNQIRRKPLPENKRPEHAVSTGRITRWKLFTDRYWIYELFSCLLALSALASIIGVLEKFNSRPIPEWPNLISINTLIATLTAILKASLLLPVTEGISELKWAWFKQSRPLIDISAYDSASRGPWGSFLFLIFPKADFLASLGALITVIALAIDPFSQQVIRYENCLQPFGANTAQIVRTNNYSALDRPTGVVAGSLDGPMTLAIYNGLLNPPSNASSLISFQCSSGNCTFPSNNGESYSSLAMCYEIQDISQYIQANTSSGASSFTLPSGARLSQSIQMFTLVPSASGDDDNDDRASYPPQNVTGTLFTFEALMYSCTAGTAVGGVCNSTFAFRTSLYPCMKIYGANITDSILTETVISSMPLPIATENPSFVLYVNQTLRDGVWSDCQAVDGAQSSFFSVPVSTYTTNDQGELSIVNTGKWCAPDCIYALGSDNFEPISAFLATLFDNKMLQSPHALFNYVDGDLWLMNLYQDGSANLSTVDTYMQGLANSMTARIRAGGDPAPAGFENYASGIMYENQVCIRVRWGWLALPAALVLVGIGFLIATIFLTSTQAKFGNHGHFKSSPLALLFHGIDPRTLEHNLQQPSDVARMEDLAENLKVRRSGEGVAGKRGYFVPDK